MRKLLLIVSVLTCACTGGDQVQISLEWEGRKAVRVLVSDDLCSDGLTCRIRGAEAAISLLGEWTKLEGSSVFQPVVPFTNGLTYDVFCNESKVGEFSVPDSDAQNPKLLSVHPSLDTVPMNLLKMYFRFSEPMAEGRSAEHVFLLHGSDTLKETFLDLQPELWNEDGTVLTLWLDPGRIKRDLIPNQELGNPLKENETYSLAVSTHWKSREGKMLEEEFLKKIITGPRDEKMPSLNDWVIKTPKAGSSDELTVYFNDELDYSLIHDAISVQLNGETIEGKLTGTSAERGLVFVPELPWKEGEYKLIAEGRLEDLCGNNLNRPFDRDLKAGQGKTEQSSFKRSFRLK